MGFITKRRLASPALALLAVVAVAGVASAGTTTYRTFGDVKESPVGTFTIVSDQMVLIPGYENYGPQPEDGGVYLNSKSVSGKRIGAVSFSFRSSGHVAGGAPRFSLPINTDGVSNKVAFYAFIDVNGCGSDTFVSTTNSACSVNAGSEVFANWAAFAAAHPSYRVAPGSTPFIVADGALGTYTVSDIVLR
jgi:hypothetical protein